MTTCGYNINNYKHFFYLIDSWISWVQKSVATGVTDNVLWGAYHALHGETSYFDMPAICSLLPLFHDQAKSSAMIKHAMDMIKKAVDHINSGQIPVIAVNQPLYSLTKQIQWQWSETHGESKFVILLGGLHIEMAFLNVLGDGLEKVVGQSYW